MTVKLVASLGMALLLSASASACGVSSSPSFNGELKSGQEVTSTEGVSSSTTQKSAPSLAVSWQDGAPDSFGGADSAATIGDVRVVQSSMGYYCLVMDVTYQNSSDTSSNLINDVFCHVEAFQSGVQLDGTGITSEPGVYDYIDAFTLVKDGGSVSTELVWELRDTTSPIELEFGRGSDNKPLYNKILTINAED